MEDSKFKNIVLHNDTHCKLDSVNRKIIGQLRSKFVEPPADDLDGMVGIDVVIHQIGVCSKYFCMGLEVKRLQFVQ